MVLKKKEKKTNKEKVIKNYLKDQINKTLLILQTVSKMEV